MAREAAGIASGALSCTSPAVRTPTVAAGILWGVLSLARLIGLGVLKRAGIAVDEGG
jgi:hypothetical protein